MDHEEALDEKEIKALEEIEALNADEVLENDKNKALINEEMLNDWNN